MQQQPGRNMLTTHPFDDDKLREECGIFGVCGGDIGAALVALFFAWRRIFRPARACAPDDVCAVPQVRTAYKVIFWIVSALVLIALAFPYVMPLFY